VGQTQTPHEDNGAPRAALIPAAARRDNARAQTQRRRLTHIGLSWREPAQLWDVDRPSDVRRMRREGMDELLAGIGREQQPPETFGFPWVPPHARESA
jgi:hypothetical protein